ncbi:MAG: hypothetical protein E6929_03625 [Clostridium sp.]|nr:hypothetical protein [Clostridium sp.]
MKKKKIVLTIFVFTILISVAIVARPYIFSSTKLISRNNYNYNYIRATALDWDSINNFIELDNTQNSNVDALINLIDNLSVRRTLKPKSIYNYTVTFTATYSENDSSTYTQPVFTLQFYSNNVIGFYEKSNYKKQYFKIEDKEFDIEKIIENLQ